MANVALQSGDSDFTKTAAVVLANKYVAVVIGSDPNTVTLPAGDNAAKVIGILQETAEFVGQPVRIRPLTPGLESLVRVNGVAAAIVNDDYLVVDNALGELRKGLITENVVTQARGATSSDGVNIPSQAIKGGGL